MVKIKITPQRFAEACNIYEYINTQNGDDETIARIAPRFVLGDDGEYIVKAVLDDDGDLETFENIALASIQIAKITPTRFGELKKEFMEAARTIVNPPKDGG